MSIYESMVEAGIETDSHESDLYVPHSSEALAILREFRGVKWGTFAGSDGRTWIEIPFMFEPFWKARERPES